MKFLGRRALHAVLLLLSVSVLSLLLVKLTPGDFFDSMRINPQISTETLAAMRAEQGLDKPLPALYLQWFWSAARGEWGFSFAYNAPAGPILWPRVRNTLLLGFCATALAWTVGLAIGVAAAVKTGSWADIGTSAVIATLLGIPELVSALLLLMVAAHFSWLSPIESNLSDSFPLSGTGAGGLRDLPGRILLPAVCLAGGLLPILISHVRTAVVEALEAPYVTAARSFGISFWRIVWRHAIPAAANPLISLAGLSIGLLMSSSLIAESVFNWPGLGQLMLQAIWDRDIFLIVDAAVLSAALLIAGNLAADVLLYFGDPRIRVE